MNDKWQAELISTIATFRRLSGDLRFGQFLYNSIALADREKDGNLDMNYQEDFHTRLFYLEDRELADILLHALRENENFLEMLKST